MWRTQASLIPKFSRGINLFKNLQPVTLGLKIPNAWTVRLSGCWGPLCKVIRDQSFRFPLNSPKIGGRRGNGWYREKLLDEAYKRSEFRGDAPKKVGLKVASHRPEYHMPRKTLNRTRLTILYTYRWTLWACRDFWRSRTRWHPHPNDHLRVRFCNIIL